MTTPDPRIEAIRTDHIVGRGTCSVIDECWTDDMLLDELDIEQIGSKVAALRWARRVHRTWHAVADDIAATAW